MLGGEWGRPWFEPLSLVVTRKSRHILEEIWCCQVREKRKLNFIKQGSVLSGGSGW